MIFLYQEYIILEKMLSDGLKWKSAFSWKRWANMVKTDVFDTLVWKVDIERIDMRSFSTEGIGLNGHMGSTFSKNVQFPKTETLKIVRKCSEMGLEKWSGGLERSGKVKIALRMQWKHSRTPKTPIKNKKSRFWGDIWKTPDQPPWRLLFSKNLSCRAIY